MGQPGKAAPPGRPAPQSPSKGCPAPPRPPYNSCRPSYIIGGAIVTARRNGLLPTRSGPERAILVGVEVKGAQPLWTLEESLDELEQLAVTAGAQVVERVTQRLEGRSPTYLGKGKLEELKALRVSRDASVVIFDDELAPAQQRNLEQALQVKVIDRTALILDVFARHARTREGQLQVELAQHQYLLPRLRGQWQHLERLGGGIGTRGPGETQLETDRRLIRRRIQKLEEALEQVSRRRSLYRSRRGHQGAQVVSLVGYTNAGKSTLFNALTQAGVLAEDKLFATLDPVTRRVGLPSGRNVVMTDTVGFIHKLPPTLVAAFRATLEELQDADLLLHVVDVSHPRAAEQAQVVDETLAELGLRERPRLLVLNKADLLAPSLQAMDALQAEGALRLEGASLHQHPSVLVSAVHGWGLDRLRAMIESTLAQVRRYAQAREAERRMPAWLRDLGPEDDTQG